MPVKAAIKAAAPKAAAPAKTGNGKSVQPKKKEGLFTIGTVQRKEHAGNWVHQKPQRALHARAMVQLKIKVHPSNDHYEKEADAIADKVVAHQPVTSAQTISKVNTAAQRKCAHCEKEEKELQTCSLQRKCASCEKKEEVQTKRNASIQNKLNSADSGPPGRASPNIEPLSAALSAQSTRGSPIPLFARRHMEHRIGANFGNVRIHTGRESHAANTAIGARAFTNGAHIHFAQGEYNPQSQRGRHLLAHELVHTVQQGASHSTQNGSDTIARKANTSSSTIPFISGIDTFNTGHNKAPPVQRKEDESSCVQCALIDTAISRVSELLTDLPSITDGLEGAKHWLLEKMRRFASFIPGYSALGVVLGQDPITGARIERNGRNFIEAALDIIPGGSLLKRKLEELGAIDRAATWIDGQLESLSSIIANTKSEFDQAWNDLGIGSIIDGPLNILRTFGGIFERAINNLVTFAQRAAGQLLDMVKEFLMTQLVNFIKEHTNAYELLKVVIGHDPVTQEEVARNGTNVLNALLELGGEQGREQRRQMQETGTFQKAADWIDRGILVFGNLYQTVRNNIGLIWDAVSIESLMEPVATFNRIYETFAEPVRQVLAFVVDALKAILALIKEALMARLSAWARTVRGYPLITVIIGKDPFTDEVVPRNVQNIIKGFMSLMDGGEEQYRQMEESGAIGRAAARIDAAIARLNMSPATIIQLFIDLWNSFSFSDISNPIAAFQRILARFGEPIARLVAFVIEIVKIVIEVILQIMNFPFDLINNIITRAMAAIESIKRDPIGFLKNLLRAIKQGFIQFFNNILTHLRNGLVGWLMSELQDANVPQPTDFSLRGIITWGLQVLGISMEAIWQKLAAHPRIGPERVARLRSMIDRVEGIWTFIRDVQQRGMAAIWDKIAEQLSNLWNTVMDAVKNWIMERIVNQVTARLLSMLDPTGIMAVINSAIAIYRAVQSFMRYLRQMLEVVNSFVNGVADIAEGNVATAANYLERTMGRAMPIVIGFLANQVGLSGIGRRIGEMIGAARALVDRALTWLVNRAVDTGFAIFDRLMSMGRSAVSAVSEFLGLRREFRNQAGETHTISIEEQGGRAQLMIASRKRTYVDRVNEIEVDAADTAKVTAKSDALVIARQVDVFLNRDAAFRRANRSTLDTLVANLTAKTALIMPPESGPSVVINVGSIIRLGSANGGYARVTQLAGNNTISYETLGLKRNVSGRLINATLNMTYWRGSEDALVLTATRLDEMNKLEVWPSMPVARAVLNWRRSGFQRNSDATKQWEHKIENRTSRSGIHSSDNLFWCDADFNQWLNTEMGAPGRKQIVVGSQLRILSYREYVDMVNTDAAHREVKEDLYDQRGYVETPRSHPDRGQWNELVAGPPRRRSRSPGVMPKLHSNISDNHFEREADHIADKVVSGKKNTQHTYSRINLGIQRKAYTGLKTKPVEKISVPRVTTKKIIPATTRGSPLPKDTRKEMEYSMGADFSKVRIHKNDDSHKANTAIGARAFTAGADIHFAKGEYKPETKTGKHLLAHELAHTVQQGAAPFGKQSGNDVSTNETLTVHQKNVPASATGKSKESEITKAKTLEEQRTAKARPEANFSGKSIGGRKVEAKAKQDKKVVQPTSKFSNASSSQKEDKIQFKQKIKAKKTAALSKELLKKTKGKTLNKDPVKLPKKEEKKDKKPLPKPVQQSIYLKNAISAVAELNQIASSGIQYKPDDDKKAAEQPARKIEIEQGKSQANSVMRKAAAAAAIMLQNVVQASAGLNVKASVEKARIKANESVQKNIITAAFKKEKDAVQKATYQAAGSINGYHTRVIAQLKAAAVKAKADMLIAKTINTIGIELAAALQLPKIDKTYTDAKADFESSGSSVGNECYSRQSQRSWSDFISKMKHEDDSLLDGPYTDDIKQAKGDAAVKVGEGYKDGMVKAGKEQADKIEEGKPNDYKKISDAKAEMLKGLNQTYDTADKAIDASEKNGLSQTDSTKKSMLSSVYSQHKAAKTQLETSEKMQSQLVEVLATSQSIQIDLQTAQAKESMEMAGAENITRFLNSFKEFKNVTAQMNSPPAALLRATLIPIEVSIATATAAMTSSLQAGVMQVGLAMNKTANETITMSNAAVVATIADAKTNNDKSIDGLKKLQSAAITALQSILNNNKKTIISTASQCVTDIQNIKTAFDGALTQIGTDLANGLKAAAAELKKGLLDTVNNGGGENKSMLETSIQNENEAADKVEPRWKSVLKVLLVVVVILVIALVVGPAVIGFIGAAAGGGAFGAAVGAVVGGAILGAASSAVITIGNNLIDGKTWYAGVGHAMLEGAITGAIGGAFGAAGGGVAGKIFGAAAKGIGPTLGRFAIQQTFDFAGNIVVEYAGSKLNGQPFSWESVAKGQAMGAGMHIGMEGLGALKNVKGFKTVNNVMESSAKAGEHLGGSVRSKFTSPKVAINAPVAKMPVEESVNREIAPENKSSIIKEEAIQSTPKEEPLQVTTKEESVKAPFKEEPAKVAAKEELPASISKEASEKTSPKDALNKTTPKEEIKEIPKEETIASNKINEEIKSKNANEDETKPASTAEKKPSSTEEIEKKFQRDEDVKAKVKKEDGHELKVDSEGNIAECSNCKVYELTHKDTLDAHPELKDELKSLREKMKENPDGYNKELAEFDKKLNEQAEIDNFAKAQKEGFDQTKIDQAYEEYKAKKAKQGKTTRPKDNWQKGKKYPSGKSKGGYENTIKGRVGEHQADFHMNNDGFVKQNHDGKLIEVSDAPKGKGIDGVWTKDGEVYVTETKFNDAELKPGQMTDSWIRDRLPSLDGPTRELVENAMKNGTLKKMVLRVNENGIVTREPIK